MRRTLGAVAAVIITVALAAWWVTRPVEEASTGTEPDQADARAAGGASRAAAVRVPRVRGREGADDDARSAAAEDVRIRIAAAENLRARIDAAVAENRWNDALRLLNEFDSTYKDQAVRAAARFDELEAKVVKGRDAWFVEKLPLAAFAAIDELIAAKVREQTVGSASDAARAGTLAAARTWANRELDALLWEKAASDLGLTKEEIEKYWGIRRVAEPRVAGYAKGSFIVVKPRPGSGTPMPSAQEDWWSTADSTERAGFLTAYFVETSNRFEILRADDAGCPACGGHGGSTSVVCAQCNGCGVIRSVTYR